MEAKTVATPSAHVLGVPQLYSTATPIDSHRVTHVADDNLRVEVTEWEQDSPQWNIEKMSAERNGTTWGSAEALHAQFTVARPPYIFVRVVDHMLHLAGHESTQEQAGEIQQ